jgi:hypothetical protein
MQTISAKLMTKEQTSFTELLDNVEGIILDLDNLHYYTLNTTGLFVWKQLRSGLSLTREQLCEALAKAYNVDGASIETEVDGFLEELETNGLIHELKGDVQSSAKLAESNGQLPVYEAPRLKLSNSLTQVVLSGSSTIATAAIATG